MRSHVARHAIAAVSLFALISSGSLPMSVGEAQTPTLEEMVARPIAVLTGIGAAHEPVMTRSKRAQESYDQGLACLHSYNWIDAARSFNEALRADPKLAMAHVGLSYAAGELGLSAAAREASRAAQPLAPAASTREQFRIELRARQLAAADRPGDAAAASAYKAYVDRVLTDFPSDVELLLLAGHAQSAAHDGHGMSASGRSLDYYERARRLAPDYFAVHHYLAHAYENVGRTTAALEHAERFARLAPDVPHAHHMFGHVLRRVDRMREAIAEFAEADELHLARAAQERIPPALDWHYRHNLDLLGTSHQYLGLMKQADGELRRSFDTPGVGVLGEDQDVNKRAWPLLLRAQRRFDQALSAAQMLQKHTSPLLQALGHVLASRILVGIAQLDGAAMEGNLALRQMRAIGPAGGTLLPDFELAQGEYLLRTGERTKGRAMLRDAAAKLGAERGPDAWIGTLFQLEALANTAREVGELDLADEMAELMRRHDPYYAGTQYAVGLAAERRGDRASARTALADAVRRWRDADPDLPALADARIRLQALATRATPPPARSSQPTSQPTQR
jgi:tetratricopeptide (TPR) repeat protein